MKQNSKIREGVTFILRVLAVFFNVIFIDRTVVRYTSRATGILKQYFESTNVLATTLCNEENKNERVPPVRFVKTTAESDFKFFISANN